ncbi:STAS domain-containing protein [Pontibacter sp. MBLB2868]|uniref:STAS domain-containing protein n=1 Tax=Pontibacter sp. MBLB2868 TaxID=3451555 RepID=UPI003F757039
MMITNCVLEGEIYHIYLRGTLDSTNANAIVTAVRQGLQAGATEIWVDCKQLDEICPIGLEFLTLLQHWLQEQRKSLLLLHLNHTIMQLFQRVQLDATLPVYPTIESAYNKRLFI